MGKLAPLPGDPATFQLTSEVRASFPDMTIMAPCIDGLPPKSAAKLSVLPIHDANGRLLAAIEPGVEPGEGRAFCGLFAADPFRSHQHMLGRLIQAGATGVANFPTLGALDDEMLTSLGALNMGIDQELHLLDAAKRAGFKTAILLTTHQMTGAALALGVDNLVLPNWISTRVRNDILSVVRPTGRTLAQLV